MPPVKERRTRRSFSLHPCSIFHIPLRKRSVRRSGAAPDPRRCRGAGDRSVKTIRLKSRGLHRSIWDKSWGSLASTHPHGPCAVRVRGPRETNYRAHTRRLLSRAAPAVSIAQFFGRTPSVFPDIFLRKNFLPRVRGVLRPAAETPPSPARRWGDSISPALTEHRELSGRAIVHRIVRRARQAHEVPETVRILRVILGRPDVMHHLRRLAPTVPGRFPAPISVPPERQRAQPPPALVLS